MFFSRCTSQEFPYKEKTYEVLNEIYHPKDPSEKKTLLSINHDLCNSNQFVDSDLFEWLIDQYDSRFPPSSNFSGLKNKSDWYIDDCDFKNKKFDSSKLNSYFNLTEKTNKEFEINDVYQNINSVVFNKNYVIVVSEFYSMKTARLFHYQNGKLIEVAWETDPRQAQE